MIGKSENSDDNRLEESTKDFIHEVGEVVIDGVVKSEVLKAIPFVKIAAIFFEFGRAFREKQFERKLKVYFEELQKGTKDPEGPGDFRERFQNDPNFRQQFLGYVVENIYKFESEYKAKVMAHLVLALEAGQISYRRFTDLCSSLNLAHVKALERLAIQDEHTIPPDTKQPIYDKGIPIQADLDDIALLQACGLAVQPEEPIEGVANIWLTSLGFEMLIYGVKPDGPWKQLKEKRAAAAERKSQQV